MIQLKILRSMLLGGLIAGSIHTTSFAQTLVSNLAQTYQDFRSVGDGGGAADPIILGMSFTTGSSAATLTKATLAFSTAYGSPSGFTMGLYNSFTAGVGPSGLVTTLTGSDPLLASNYDFVGAATLAANSTYYLIASVPGATGAGSNHFNWNRTLSTAQDGGSAAGWTIGDTLIVNNSFNNWATVSTPLMFSVEGSAIPEPSTYAALAGCGALALAWYRRRGSRGGQTLNPASKG